jgi:hypothetical protein
VPGDGEPHNDISQMCLQNLPFTKKFLKAVAGIRLSGSALTFKLGEAGNKQLPFLNPHCFSHHKNLVNQLFSYGWRGDKNSIEVGTVRN